MNSEKIENILNLSMDVSEQEREKSQELSTGYNPREDTWDIIVRYQGSLDGIRREMPDIRIVELEGQYAIFTLAQSLIDRVAERTEIIYIEKPKRLFFALQDARRVSCVSAVEQQPFSLTGRGVIVAVIDSGECVR